ncbi:MAG: NTP transferase domain-containing protein [Planctomycetota bacterium]|nr:NTP transferase domain-containing protein [Planctomycetota bacterium]
MASRASLYSIVLAAGKGKRMRSQNLHKVCFPIAGVPAIIRALDVYNRSGISRNVVVVGDLAGQVVELVGQKFRNTVFAYQPQALGTGDAARCGLQALAEVNPDARLLLVAGDKLVDSAALTRLIDRCDAIDADLGLIVSRAEWGGDSAGRVLFDEEQRPLGIVEAPDIRLRRCRGALWELARGAQMGLAITDILAIVERELGAGKKLEQVVPDPPGVSPDGVIDRKKFLKRLESIPRDFHAGPADKSFSPQEAWVAPFRNEFVYLVKKRALEYGLKHMDAANAQGEAYLTDAVGAICSATRKGTPQFRVCHIETETPHEIQSYNNPEELLRIEDHLHGEHHQSLEELRERLGTGRFKPLADWLRLFPGTGELPAETRQTLVECYGDDPETIQERAAAYRSVLKAFEQNFGFERSVLLVRSPGRINVMGRHVDWQGGRCNLMAVTQEVLLAVAPRNDDCVEARNVDPVQFPPASISLGKLVSRLEWDNWLSVVNSEELTRHLRDSAGNWRLYIEAALLRLQMAYRATLLSGMDMAVCGNIPVAAGLSSSSAIVVATAEAALALHGLELTPQQFVNFCGEGEWFVGTRGGSADHAAMKLGMKGTINHVTFHDFEVLEQLAFPSTHMLVVANSQVQAKKAAGAKAAFNSRVGSYLVGLQIVKRKFPRLAPFIRFIRDLNTDTLQVPSSRIYEILLALPLAMSAAEVRTEFRDDPEVWKVLEPHFGAAPDDAVYPVRGVVMFGVAECARSRRAADLLRDGDMRGLGRLMRISHDGERCFQIGPAGVEPFEVDISDDALHGLIDDLTSQDLSRVEHAQLHLQPGGYRCSTEEIDSIVDIAGRIPGVEGAQIAGAGLGGCAMILVRVEQVDALRQALLREYYEARGLTPGVLKCTASAGSCVVSIG